MRNFLIISIKIFSITVIIECHGNHIDQIIFPLLGVDKGGVQRFNGHLYWFSWQDNDNSVKNAKWDWFNARNYCRKRCMDLVSFESREEYEWVKGFVNGKQTK